MLENCKTTPLVIHQEASQDSAFSHTHSKDFLQQKDIEQDERERVHGVKFEGNQARASKVPLPMQSCRIHLIPPSNEL